MGSDLEPKDLSRNCSDHFVGDWLRFTFQSLTDHWWLTAVCMLTHACSPSLADGPQWLAWSNFKCTYASKATCNSYLSHIDQQIKDNSCMLSLLCLLLTPCFGGTRSLRLTREGAPKQRRAEGNSSDMQWPGSLDVPFQYTEIFFPYCLKEGRVKPPQTNSSPQFQLKWLLS